MAGKKEVIILLAEIYTIASPFGASFIAILLIERFIPAVEIPLKIFISTRSGIVKECSEGLPVNAHESMQSIYTGPQMLMIVLLLYLSEYRPHILIKKMLLNWLIIVRAMIYESLNPIVFMR